MPYTINKKDKILIYGAGILGISVAKKLIKNGYNIVAFLDKDAEKKKKICNPINVYVLGEEPAYLKKADNIVFISLNNALEHEKTAQLLRKNGYRKLVFLPMVNGRCSKETSEMRKVYNSIIYGNINESTTHEIPLYDECHKSLPAIIERQYGRVIAYFPIEMIFTQELDVTFGAGLREIQKAIISKYADINIGFVDHYFEMYKFIENGQGNCEQYLQTQIFAEDNEVQRLKIIYDRRKLFEIYMEALLYNSEFFISSAPIARIRKNGTLSLIDGIHRASFLVYKGATHIPLSLSESDFALLYKENEVRILNHYLKDRQLDFPILHPAYIDLPIENKRFGIEVAPHIFRYISQIHFDTILDAFTNGYFARLAQIFNFNNFTFIFDGQQEKLYHAIARLYGFSKKSILNAEKATESNYDVCFLFGNNVDYAMRIFCKVWIMITTESIAKEAFPQCDNYEKLARSMVDAKMQYIIAITNEDRGKNIE